MQFELFEKMVEILDEATGDKLRKRYIETFINTDHELYREHIEVRHQFCDGYGYLGYLWDFIKHPVIIEKEYIEAVAENIGEVYVFWDIHSCERIFIKDYWKFGKKAVLKVDLKTLLEGWNYLPEDIYIFDKTMAWTLIKTHEDMDGKCYCLMGGSREYF